MRVNTFCVQVITSKSQARGLKMYRDDLIKALDIGRSYLSDTSIGLLEDDIMCCQKSLDTVPKTWAMSHGERCALGLL